MFIYDGSLALLSPTRKRNTRTYLLSRAKIERTGANGERKEEKVRRGESRAQRDSKFETEFLIAEGRGQGPSEGANDRENEKRRRRHAARRAVRTRVRFYQRIFQLPFAQNVVRSCLGDDERLLETRE